MILREQRWWEWVAEAGRTEKMELLPLCAQAQEGGLTQHSKDLCGADAEVLGAAVQGFIGEFRHLDGRAIADLTFQVKSLVLAAKRS